MLNKSATIIQRHWRGFVARKTAKARVKDQVTKMWLKYYDRCATMVQALWRGYRSRKHGVDLPKYRQWLRTVSDKNDQAVAKMKEYEPFYLHFWDSCGSLGPWSNKN